MVIRETRDNRSFLTYSFNSGLVWRAGSEDVVRLLAGRSIQTPSLLVLSSTIGMKPAAMENIQLGWDHDFSDIFSKVHASVYRQWYDNVMGTTANRGSSRTDGLELTIDGREPSGWSWNASLNARSVSDMLAPPPSLRDMALDYEATTPKYVATLGIGKAWDDFEIDLLGKWQSKSQDWAPRIFPKTFVPVPSYVTMTARVGYKINDNFTVAFTASQFNKATIYEGAGVPDKSRYLVTLTSSL